MPVIKFQPTRPLRGATPSPWGWCSIWLDFNPRAPCGARPFVDGNFYAATFISTHAPLAGRDKLNKKGTYQINISTHAPLAGRDVSHGIYPIIRIIFQPTRPLRGATKS